MPKTSINYVARKGTIEIKIVLKGMKKKVKRKQVIKNINWLILALYEDDDKAISNMKRNITYDIKKCKRAWEKVKGGVNYG